MIIQQEGKEITEKIKISPSYRISKTLRHGNKRDLKTSRPKTKYLINDASICKQW